MRSEDIRETAESGTIVREACAISELPSAARNHRCNQCARR